MDVILKVTSHCHDMPQIRVTGENPKKPNEERVVRLKDEGNRIELVPGARLSLAHCSPFSSGKNEIQVTYYGPVGTGPQ